MTKRYKNHARFEIKGRRFFVYVNEEWRQFDAEALSIAANVSISTAYKWISGVQSPHPDTLELLSIREFGLITGTDEWRFKNDHLHCHGYRIPFHINTLHIVGMLSQLQTARDTQNVMNANKIAELETQIADAHARFIQFATENEPVAAREFSSIFNSPERQNIKKH